MPLLEEIGLIGEALLGVEKVVEGVVKVLQGLNTKTSPLLNDSQQLAINLLQAVGKSATDPLHLAEISSRIGIIQADATKVDEVINSLGVLFTNFKSVANDVKAISGETIAVTPIKIEGEISTPPTEAAHYTGGDN